MRRAGSVSLFAAISLALHLAWVIWMPEGAPLTQPATHWVEVSFEAPAPASLSEEAVALNEAAALEQSSLQPQPEPAPLVQSKAAPSEPRRKPVKLEPQAQEHPALPQVTTLDPQPEPVPPSAAAPTVALPQPVAPKQLSISPRAAALSLEAFGPKSGALRCASPTVGQTDCAPTEEQTGRAAQAALTRDLNATAHSVAHLRAREHPTLKRRSDGSYGYDGHVFQAVVRPDGNVEFRDNAVEGQLRVSPVPFVFTADLNDLVERHVLGRELYSAEKQWLLDETRALRDQLASEYRRRELQGANRELERTLQSLLHDEKLTLTRKHEAIFLLWQDCGDEAQAAAHRKAVDSFVRRYMPKGSAVGFLADELEHFNASRGRLQKFEPYAGS